MRPDHGSRSTSWCDSWAGGDVDAAFRARVELQSLCSEYGWSLWGFIQAATSPMDFDFHGWGMERFEKAVRRFTSDGFDALLDAVATPVVEVRGALATSLETTRTCGGFEAQAWRPSHLNHRTVVRDE